MVFLRFEPNQQNYLSLINGYVNAEKYFSVLMLWNEVKRKICAEGERKFKLDASFVDAFLYALVKGGFFDAVMQVVEKTQEMRIFVDKWRYKQAFMEKHKKLKVSKLRKRNNSGSFLLDRASPFSVKTENMFVLVGCSRTSPVFDQSADFCDTGSGLNICRGLYSCEGVTGIGLEQNGPISTCVYDPTVLLGPGYGVDLPKLQCSSYAALYGFGGDEGDPMKWQYGISLQYNTSNKSEACKSCEESGGICGFSVLDESFACMCQNGAKTTINCYGRGYARSGTWRHKIQTKLNIGGFLLVWMIFV